MQGSHGGCEQRCFDQSCRSSVAELFDGHRHIRSATRPRGRSSVLKEHFNVDLSQTLHVPLLPRIHACEVEVGRPCLVYLIVVSFFVLAPSFTVGSSTLTESWHPSFLFCNFLCCLLAPVSFTIAHSSFNVVRSVVIVVSTPPPISCLHSNSS